jgi:hypothetical protein
VNAVAIYFVFDHLERLREEAARDHLARHLAPRPSAVERLRAAVASLGSRPRPAGAAPAAA